MKFLTTKNCLLWFLLWMLIPFGLLVACFGVKGNGKIWWRAWWELFTFSDTPSVIVFDGEEDEP